MSRFVSFVFLVFCFLNVGISSVLAQTGAGIGLKPATFEEQMKPGDSRQFSIEVSNLSGEDQTYYLYKRDITGVKDGGVPIFADPDMQKTSFELTEWMTLAVDTIDIPKDQSRFISFILTVPNDASPGSHFGGVFVSLQPPKMRESGASVGYEVANIVSVRVAGEAVEKAQIRQFSTDNYVYGSPNVNFNVRIENSGNTLIRPTGPLEVTNMFGKKVAKLTFNQELAGVFPGTTREFTLAWKESGTMFGRYEAVISPVYGEDGYKQTVSSTVTFWILPKNIILPALGILVTLLFGTYITVRVYIKRKLSYYGAAHSGRRLVRRRKDSSSSTLLLLAVVMLVVTALFMLMLLALFA